MLYLDRHGHCVMPDPENGGPLKPKVATIARREKRRRTYPATTLGLLAANTT